jgi:hypothetical protein
MDCFKATLFDDYAETMSSVKVSIPVSVTSAEAHHSNFNNLVFFILCVQLSLLSFFVLDEADRMVEKGHFQELQSIIDMLPSTNRKLHSHSLVQASTAPNGKLPRHESESDDREAPTHREEGVEEMPVDGVQFGSDIHEPQNETLKKKRQTLVFSATLALPPGFKKKLKRGFLGDNGVSKKNEYSVASLSERAGVSHQAAIIDLTTQTVVAKKLEESVIECREEEKDAYLYYVLKVHGCGRTLVFCTSIAALRRVSALLRLLQVPVWPLHAQMQQKQRLKVQQNGFVYSLHKARSAQQGTRSLVSYVRAAKSEDSDERMRQLFVCSRQCCKMLRVIHRYLGLDSKM